MASSQRAVVIGASIGGLLAARVLADHFDEVVVLDRDQLPEEPVPRGGTPQCRHAHSLLARGRAAMEDLLPGLTAQLVAQGAEVGDVQTTSSFYVGGRPLARGTSGLLALRVSRPLLEWQVRQRVLALPQVQIRDRTSAIDLVFSDDYARVSGVSLSQLDWPGTCDVVESDLVVDASGRTTRTVEWLERRGYAAPHEDHVRVDVVYATRAFRRRADDLDGELALLQPVGPGLPCAGVMLAQEDERWTVSVAGYHGIRPPTTLGEFTAYAKTMPGPLGSVLEGLEPLDDGAHYRFAANVRRRFERMPRFPVGLLVLGDAWCAFDPAFGQGMSVAALEAVELGSCLRGGRADLAGRYFSRAAHHIDTPWTITVGRDRQLPGSTDPTPLPTRLVNRYISALLRAATSDPVLATAFLRVSHLAARPTSLMSPRLLVRVVLAWLRPVVSPTRAGEPALVASAGARRGAARPGNADT